MEKLSRTLAYAEIEFKKKQQQRKPPSEQYKAYAYQIKPVSMLMGSLFITYSWRDNKYNSVCPAYH